ncbi:PREDICTED: gustatory and pheromone receptor 32a-like [Rhagoletis zephyria]|uniref:gustatory and pheromone receptor 32a-like n=1 Tax=Rhagoletis zephyria TaxID=28612 RepID=UPI00081186EC|nr:PREDICTED: gustatory and pheromone receptor 32a-like [Rhagoletis zephyria]
MKRHNNRDFYRKQAKLNVSPAEIVNPILSYLKWILLILKSVGLMPFYTTLNFYKIGVPNRRWLLISRGIICIKFSVTLIHLYFTLTPAISQIFFRQGYTDGLSNIFNITFCILTDANKTSQVLARIYGKGDNFQEIVDKFLTKSIKQNVQFTVYGFFVINNSTLFKIFSAVVTYLVILIQFKQLEESRTLQ